LRIVKSLRSRHFVRTLSGRFTFMVRRHNSNHVISPLLSADTRTLAADKRTFLDAGTVGVHTWRVCLPAAVHAPRGSQPSLHLHLCNILAQSTQPPSLVCSCGGSVKQDLWAAGARCRRGVLRGARVFFFFFFTLVTGPRRSLGLKLSDTRVYGPQIRARLGNHKGARVPPRCCSSSTTPMLNFIRES